jgi:hypothetical protein
MGRRVEVLASKRPLRAHGTDKSERAISRDLDNAARAWLAEQLEKAPPLTPERAAVAVRLFARSLANAKRELPESDQTLVHEDRQTA